MLDEPGFDPIDMMQMRLLLQLPPHQRVRLMLEARELAVGLIRGRLRQCHPDLSGSELGLKVVEETLRGERTFPRPLPVSRYPADTGSERQRGAGVWPGYGRDI